MLSHSLWKSYNIYGTTINYGSVSENKFSLTLSPQTIRQIQLTVDASITTRDTGILATLDSVIEIEIYDLTQY